MRSPHGSVDKKLVLKRETFRCLDAEVLHGVRGGQNTDADDCSAGNDHGPGTCVKFGWTGCGMTGAAHCGGGALE